ncbi:alpha/beta fold hydrolase [Actinomadura sp. LD22]|uniref:Alpha/beta fold hydrolase n=1 Tax=Actinomadura physcomitrii TaxID=2650748 RepID=A0A6I4MK45_9ACTN|nr:alpha/beta hydrolase [Actinomadura physcomitrii]MWA04955.1 alpha/beta fold hydrolase [Actinomadura physcomitrii]
MPSVTFKNRNLELAGDLRLPAGFDPAETYAAIICVHPGSGVKEQTAGLYAAKMAERGYAALAFDASYQGESGGEPRYAEEPASRVEDIRCAVDHLVTLDFIDEDRIGVLGICAGGGYAVNAAMTEHRISAVGAVSPINIGRARREGGNAVELLEEAGRQRTIEARTGRADLRPWIPDTPEEARAAGITDADVLEAVDYYRTPRGRHPNSTNRLRFVSVASVIAFDAFHLVEELLTQPLQVVVGDRVGGFGSYRDGYELFRRATSDKALRVVDGAGHYDLYDVPQYVDQAVETLTAFFDTNLAGRR